MQDAQQFGAGKTLLRFGNFRFDPFAQRDERHEHDEIMKLRNAFTAEGQVRVFAESGNTIVQVNNDADLFAEGEIQLTGVFNLAAGDFVL